MLFQPLATLFSNNQDGVQFSHLATCYEVLEEQHRFHTSYVPETSTALKLFLFLFVFRYLRLLVNITGCWLYSPRLLGPKDTFCPHDVTVIVPTVDPADVDFRECIKSILNTKPSLLIIVTAGQSRDGQQSNFDIMSQEWEGCSGVKLMESRFANKRKQLCTALSEVSELTTWPL